MASHDLRAAFDLVNVKLLIKRIMDHIKMIEVWLTNPKFYIEVDGVCSQIFNSDDRSIQGSVLGPILWAIFVSIFFDLTEITNYVDDNFVIEFNPQANALKMNLQMRLEMVIKWLKDSGLKIN
jgi:hypothetical protein